jgi:hypothetical protein
VVKSKTILFNAVATLYCIIDLHKRTGHFHVSENFRKQTASFHDLNDAIAYYDDVTLVNRKRVLEKIERLPLPRRKVIGPAK